MSSINKINVNDIGSSNFVLEFTNINSKFLRRLNNADFK
jgi:hypothetical protein